MCYITIFLHFNLYNNFTSTYFSAYSVKKREAFEKITT